MAQQMWNLKKMQSMNHTSLRTPNSHGGGMQHHHGHSRVHGLAIRREVQVLPAIVTAALRNFTLPLELVFKSTFPSDLKPQMTCAPT